LGCIDEEEEEEESTLLEVISICYVKHSCLRYSLSSLPQRETFQNPPTPTLLAFGNQPIHHASSPQQ